MHSFWCFARAANSMAAAAPHTRHSSIGTRISVSDPLVVCNCRG